MDPFRSTPQPPRTKVKGATQSPPCTFISQKSILYTPLWILSSSAVRPCIFVFPLCPLPFHLLPFTFSHSRVTLYSFSLFFVSSKSASASPEGSTYRMACVSHT